MEPVKALPENLDYDRLSLADASIITGKSKSTIRRKKAELEALGATCDPSGWVLTVTQLAAIGLLDSVTAVEPPETVAVPVVEPSHGTLANELKELYEARINDLQKALEREQNRADMAEARLERLLPAGSTHGTPMEPPQGNTEPDIIEHVEREPEPVRGLFSRWFGR